MTRYKGRTKTNLIERDFPHRVEMIVPKGGFGKRLEAMYEWHRARSIQAMRGRSRRDKSNRDYVTWCFADAAMADSFRASFIRSYNQQRISCPAKLEIRSPVQAVSRRRV